MAATYIKIAAIDAVIGGVEYTLGDTYVALRDYLTGYDGPGVYHIQLAVGSGLGGAPSYRVTFGGFPNSASARPVKPCDTSTLMTVLRCVLTPTGALVFNDTRSLNVGVQGVNSTVAQTVFPDGSFLQSGVVTERACAANLLGGSGGLLDGIGATEGDTIYRGATEWVALPPGTSGYVLTMGSTVPSWQPASGGGGLSGYGTSFPGSPTDKQLYFRTDLLALYVYLSSSPGPGWFNVDSLAQLNDVNVSGVMDGQVLTYDAGSSKWTAVTPGSSGGGDSATAFDTAILALTPEIFYKFNESSGSTLTDHSGNGNNGTYQSPSTTQLGVYGAFKDKTAAYFDGVHSYATLPIGLPTSGGWTIVMLCKLMLANQNFVCLVADGHTTGSDKGITFGMTNNDTPIPTGMAVVIQNGSGTYSTGGLGGDALSGASVLFAATFDPTANKLTMYVNGIMIGQASTAGAYVNNGTNPVSIGYNPGYGNSFLGGVYDAFALYNAVLTQAQVIALYQAMGPR